MENNHLSLAENIIGLVITTISIFLTSYLFRKMLDINQIRGASFLVILGHFTFFVLIFIAYLTFIIYYNVNKDNDEK